VGGVGGIIEVQIMVRSFFEGMASTLLLTVGYYLIAFILSHASIVIPLLVVSTSPNSLWLH
jgi:hypothetical protein